MRDSDFEMEYPEKEMVEKQIETIVMKGVKPKDSFYIQLKGMYKQMGFKYLFHDRTELFFSAIITMIILLLIGISADDYLSINSGNIYTFIFISSPILYLMICLVSYLNLKRNQTYDLEMTFKYNVYQLAAFRMLVFSIFCLGINAGFILVLSTFHPDLNILLAFMISATSLFLFSAASLILTIKIRSNLLGYFIISGWMLANLLLFVYSKDSYQLWIKHIPFYVYLVLIMGCIVIYIKSLKKLTNLARYKGAV